MKRLSLALLMLVPMWLWANQTINFMADETTNFCNPERGFYMHTEQVVTSKGETNLSKSTFSGARKYGYTLLLRLYYFDNFRDADLPKAVLDQINSDFDLFRQNGCKAVLRFAYTNDNDNYPIKDGSPEIWKRHLEQLTPILHANADVIAVVQAGFLGAWGEWYFSSTGTGTGIKKSIKDSLINQLLRAVPASRSVQLRTPDYKRKYLGISDALPDEEAFSGTARARLGHHNDAFCNNIDNCGTYYDYDIERAYLAVISEHTPIGGETNGGDSAYYAGEPSNKEMQLFHYDYMNSDYHPRVLNMWKRQQAPDGMSYYDLAVRRLGYRFSLERLNYRSFVQLGDSVRITMDIHNAGWSNLYNARTVYLVLQSETQTYCLPMQTDPRQWLAGRTTRVSETIALPADITKGIYQLYLWLPDMYASLQANAAYSIRLANMDMVWEKGMNKLNTKLIIQ